LRGLGLDPQIRPVDLDETPHPGEAAEPYVRRLAESKARARGEADELILAADTVVAIDGELLGKPVDAEDARRMLRRLGGRAHEVLTGVALWRPSRNPAENPSEDRLEAEVVTTRVVFASLTEDEIDAYVATGEPMDKAGAYAIQGRAAVFVERIDGNYSNVVGLPLPTVYRWLAAFGQPVLVAPPQA
ncbi:MAG: Maf family protein, partial [Acidobacteriota bacterium]